MSSGDNSFKAPEARVADAATAAGNFIADGRSVAAGNGVNWISGGWELFKKAPGVWIGLTIVYIVVMMVLGMIPLVNLALSLLAPVFIGGIMLGCKALDDGEDLSVGHLFAGFSNNFGNLILVGVIYLVGFIAIGLIVGVIAAVGVGAAAMGGGKVALIPMLLAALIALLLFHELAPFVAMKASFFACIKNFLPFLLYGLVVLVLAIVATIPLGLGWLVLIPVLMASMYTGYRDMFIGS